MLELHGIFFPLIISAVAGNIAQCHFVCTSDGLPAHQEKSHMEATASIGQFELLRRAAEADPALGGVNPLPSHTLYQWGLQRRKS